MSSIVNIKVHHLRLEVIWYPVFCLHVSESEFCHKRTSRIQFFIILPLKCLLHFSHSHGVKVPQNHLSP